MGSTAAAASDACPAPTLLDLPLDMLQLILGHLGNRSSAAYAKNAYQRAVLACVCRRLRAVTSQPGPLWEHVTLWWYGSTAEQASADFAAFSTRGRTTSSLQLWTGLHRIPFSTVAAVVTTFFPRLQVLECDGEDIMFYDVPDLAAMAKFDLALQKLIGTAAANVTLPAVLEPGALTGLTSLSLENTDFFACWPILLQMKALRHLSLGATSPVGPAEAAVLHKAAFSQTLVSLNYWHWRGDDVVRRDPAPAQLLCLPALQWCKIMYGPELLQCISWASLSQLTHLSLETESEQDMSSAQLAALLAHSRLKSLALIGIGPPVPQEDLCKGVETLLLRNTPCLRIPACWGRAGFKEVTLRLNHGLGLTASALEAFRSMPRLQMLDLCICSSPKGLNSPTSPGCKAHSPESVRWLRAISQQVAAYKHCAGCKRDYLDCLGASGSGEVVE